MSIFSTSFSASLLILAIIAMRALLLHRLPKKAFVALWGVALCRLLLPFSIPSRFSIDNAVNMLRALLPQESAFPTPVSLTATLDNALLHNLPAHTAETALTETAPAAISSIFASIPWYLWVWLAGIGLGALFFLFTHIHCRSVYKTALPIENRFVQEWVRTHKIWRKLRVKQSDKIAAPLAYSIWWPVILLPKDTNWQDEDQLSYILTHEYVHVRHFDAVWKWLLAAALSIHWFNPLVWVLYVLANRDLELSCDETVVRKCGESAKPGYALTLIRLAEKRNKLTPLGSNFSKNSIEERVLSIMNMKKATMIGILAAVVMIVGITTVFGTSAVPAVPVANEMAITAENENAAVTATTASYSASGRSSPAAAPNESNFNFPQEYVERMLFVSQGEPVVKVSYDGTTWEPLDTALGNESWRWWSYEEYKKYANDMLMQYLPDNNISQEALDKITARYVQTLKDIENGIRVSRVKPIFVFTSTLLPDSSSIAYDTFPTPAIYWYCYGFKFFDQEGNLVDLGLFETRDQLFAALRLYYDQEVEYGRLTLSKANILYNEIAHSIREEDEVPLQEKLLNYETYLQNMV